VRREEQGVNEVQSVEGRKQKAEGSVNTYGRNMANGQLTIDSGQRTVVNDSMTQ